MYCKREVFILTSLFSYKNINKTEIQYRYGTYVLESYGVNYTPGKHTWNKEKILLIKCSPKGAPWVQRYNHEWLFTALNLKKISTVTPVTILYVPNCPV
jgi:hypothetical protein